MTNQTENNAAAAAASSASASASGTMTIGTMPVPLPPVHHHSTHGEKPEKFNGVDFKKWQPKMHFYLTTLHLAKYVSEERPVVDPNEQNTEKLMASVN
jgi:hypothetical protein